MIDGLLEFFKIGAVRRMFAMLVLTRREVTVIFLLALLYALFEGIGIGLLLPVLQYIEGGEAALQALAGSGLWQIILAVTEALSIPLNLLTLLAMAFVPVALRFLVQYANTTYAAKAQLAAVSRLRRRAFSALMHADLGYIESIGLGTHLSFVLTQTGTGGQSILQFVNLIAAATLISLYVLLLLVLQPTLTAVAAVTLVLVSLAMRASITRSRELGEQVTKLNNRQTVAVAERVSAIRLIKMLGQEDAESDRVQSLVEDLQDKQYGIARYQSALSAVVDPVLMLSVFGIIYVGVEGFGMQLASLGVFLFVLLRLNNKVRDFNMGRQALASTISSLLFINDMQAEAIASHTIVGGARPFAGVGKEIRLSDVSYSYGYSDGEPALSDVSLTIPAGSMTALVGRSGAGKSTLAELLPHLKEPTAGTVLVDGVDLRDLDLRRLRRSIGLMSQDAILFNDSIRANIRYGHEGDVSDALIWQALVDSASAEFVEKLPEGLSTVVGDRGARLSGGQRQRLALARVLLQDSEISDS